MIRVEGVRKSYSRNGIKFNALDSIKLSFPDHGFFSVEGESGAGKSTLLNILALLDEPTEGKIYYGDALVSKKNVTGLRSRYISFVPQEGGLIEDLTVEQNLLFLTSDNALIHEVLKKVDVEGKIAAKVANLSGGEKKRVSIARCLLKGSPAIFMDEPTADLDEENAKAIFQYAKQLSSDRLVVFATHDHELAERYCEGGVKIESGKIVESSLEIAQPSSLRKEPSPKKGKLSFKTAFPFLWHTMKLKKGRVIGSFSASILSLCVFSVLLSIFSFQPVKAFSSALQSEDISFVPLLENLGDKSSSSEEWFPIRQETAKQVGTELKTASPYLKGVQEETNLPIFVFPYQEGMTFENITIKNPGKGECACPSTLGRASLKAKITNDFSSVSTIFSIAQVIEQKEQPKNASDYSDPQHYCEDLMNHFSYVVINAEDFSNIFSSMEVTSLPASNFLADDTVSQDRYFETKVRYGSFSNQTISKGRAPEGEHEVLVSRSFLAKAPIKEDKVIDTSYTFRETSSLDKTSPYFRKFIDLNSLLGSVTVVGIVDGEKADVFLSKEGAKKLSQELLYYSAGFQVYKSDINALSQAMASFRYTSVLSVLSPVYQAQKFSSSLVNKIILAGALAMLAIALFTVSTYIISLLGYRKKSFQALCLVDVNKKSSFLLFSAFGLTVSIVSSISGFLLGYLVLFLINRSLFGVLQVYSFEYWGFAGSFILLLIACLVTEFGWLAKISKKPICEVVRIN